MKLIILIAFFSTIVIYAETLRNRRGFDYNNATIKEVQSNRVKLSHDSGLGWINFEDLDVFSMDWIKKQPEYKKFKDEEGRAQAAAEQQAIKDAEAATRVAEERKKQAEEEQLKERNDAKGITPIGKDQDNPEKIDGAFGMKLGDVFDPSTAVGKGSLTDGTPMYQFIPVKPFRSFKSYYVLTTPKTNKIHSIWGIGEFVNQPTAKNEQDLLLEILKKKYGPKRKEGLMDDLYDVKQISQGDRSVIVKISGIVDVTLDIRYIDNKLQEVAEKERLELESGKADSSGL